MRSVFKLRVSQFALIGLLCSSAIINGKNAFASFDATEASDAAEDSAASANDQSDQSTFEDMASESDANNLDANVIGENNQWPGPGHGRHPRPVPGYPVPVYPAPVYPAPVYPAPVYPAPVYPGPVYPPHHRMLSCTAQNGRGMVFQAVGFNPGQVQQRAVMNCYQAGSRYCVALGCQPQY